MFSEYQSYRELVDFSVLLNQTDNKIVRQILKEYIEITEMFVSLLDKMEQGKDISPEEVEGLELAIKVLRISVRMKLRAMEIPKSQHQC
jgi:hypothetical protein